MNQGYYPEIDGLRALAVFAVICFHLDPKLLPGGFAGVDIFFTISGFVVSSAAIRLQSGSLSNLILEFYSRRVLRILPALFLCLAATMIMSVLFIPSAWLSVNVNDVGLKSFFALSNFSLADMEGYFSPRAEFNPFTHTWSLAVEEQFYLLFPLLIILGLKLKRRWAPIIFLTICSLAMAWHFTEVDPKHAFYLLHTRYWEIAAGTIAFAAYNSGSLNKLKNSNLAQGLIFFGLLLISASFVTSRNSTFPFPGALQPVVGSILTILGAVYAKDNVVSNTLKSTPFIHIGRLSYSLYLWHWPVFVMFKWTVGLESAFTKITALFLTFALSSLSFKFLEEPIRFSLFFKNRHRLATLSFGATILIAGYSFSNYINENRASLSQTRTYKESSKWFHTELPPNKNGCHSVISNTELSSSFYSKFTSSCAKSNQIKMNLFSIGDSHAVHFKTLYQSLAANHNLDVYLYNNSGCPFGRLMAKTTETHCLKSERAAIQSIASIAKPGDILFLSSLRLPRFTDQWAYFGDERLHEQLFSDHAKRNRREAEDEFNSTLEPLLSLGLKVVLVAPTFIIRDVTFRCVDWFNKNNPLCSHGLRIKRDEIDNLRKPVFKSFENITRKNKNIFIWDPLPSICSEEYCHALDRNSDPILIDSDHLSPLANQMVEPSFVLFLETKLGFSKHLLSKNNEE